MTIEVIETITPSGSSSSINFTSIPSTYDTLYFIGYMKSDGTTVWDPDEAYVRINGDSSADSHQGCAILQIGTQIKAYNTSSASFPLRFGPARGNTDYGAGAFWGVFPGYSQTTTYKTATFVGGCISNSTNAENTSGYAGLNFGSTAAVEAVNFVASSGNFYASSVITLYGIKNE